MEQIDNSTAVAIIGMISYAMVLMYLFIGDHSSIVKRKMYIQVDAFVIWLYYIILKTPLTILYAAVCIMVLVIGTIGWAFGIINKPFISERIDMKFTNVSQTLFDYIVEHVTRDPIAEVFKQ